MAAPTAPTLISISTEGLKKAGYSDPNSTQLTRAQDQYMEEVKNDLSILLGGRRLKYLYTTAYTVTTIGLHRYASPTDYANDMSMTALYGTTTGTAQTGAIGSVTLAATEDISSDAIIGRYILITSGTGASSSSQCTAYNSTTKVATVTPNFTTAPAASSGYMVVTDYYPLTQTPAWISIGWSDQPTRQGRLVMCR